MLAQMPAGGGSPSGGAGQTQQPSSPGATNSPSMQQQQQQMGETGPAMNGGPGADKAFVKKAMEGNMAEVQMGQLALQKSSDDQVKQFAQRMVDDHGKMQDQLKPVA
jgi:putative membrane protein